MTLRSRILAACSRVSALLRKPGDGESARAGTPPHADAERVIVYEPERTRDWLEEKLRERESELAALKAAHADELRRRDAALADAKKDARELQAKIAELETAKAETRRAREAEKKALRDEQERSRAALDDAKRAHESKVASLNAEHARELAAKNDELETAKADAREAGEKALRDERERSRAALDDAKRAHESKVASLNAEHARVLAAKTAELAAANAKTRSAREAGEKALRDERERARRELEAAEHAHARELRLRDEALATANGNPVHESPEILAAKMYLATGSSKNRALSSKNRAVYTYLASTLGWLGAHNFYAERHSFAVLELATTVTFLTIAACISEEPFVAVGVVLALCWFYTLCEGCLVKTTGEGKEMRGAGKYGCFWGFVTLIAAPIVVVVFILFSLS